MKKQAVRHKSQLALKRHTIRPLTSASLALFAGTSALPADDKPEKLTGHPTTGQTFLADPLAVEQP